MKLNMVFGFMFVVTLVFIPTASAYIIQEVYTFDGANNVINWVGLLPGLPFYHFAPNYYYSGIFPTYHLKSYVLLFSPNRFYGIGAQVYPIPSAIGQVDKASWCTVSGNILVPVDAADFDLAPASPSATGALLEVDPLELGVGNVWTCHGWKSSQFPAVPQPIQKYAMLVNVPASQLVGPQHPFGPYVDFATVSSYTLITATVSVAITPKALGSNITSVQFQGPFTFQSPPPMYQNNFTVVNALTRQVLASRVLPRGPNGEARVWQVIATDSSGVKEVEAIVI